MIAIPNEVEADATARFGLCLFDLLPSFCNSPFSLSFLPRLSIGRKAEYRLGSIALLRARMGNELNSVTDIRFRDRLKLHGFYFVSTVSF